MRQISVFCQMVVLAACAAVLSASLVTSPGAAPVPATEPPVAAADEDVSSGAPLQDQEEDYEDSDDDLGSGDAEGEVMNADGALVTGATNMATTTAATTTLSSSEFHELHQSRSLGNTVGPRTPQRTSMSGSQLVDIFCIYILPHLLHDIIRFSSA